MDLYQGFEAKGLRIEVIRNEAPKGESRHGTLKARITDVESGDSAGEAYYNYNLPIGGSGYEVEHDVINIWPPFRNRGFAGALETHLEDGYKRLGVKRIKLLAANVGAYAWAGQGYSFQRTKLQWWPQLQQLAGEEAPGLPSGAERIRQHAGHEVLRELEDFIRGEAEFEWQIAMWGRDRAWVEEDGTVMWPGKAYLLGNGWKGVKELD